MPHDQLHSVDQSSRKLPPTDHTSQCNRHNAKRDAAGTRATRCCSQPVFIDHSSDHSSDQRHSVDQSPIRQCEATADHTSQCNRRRSKTDSAGAGATRRCSQPGFLDHSTEDAALPSAELRGGSPLGELAAPEHQHAVAVHDRLQPVRDRQRRGALEAAAHGELDGSVRGGVQGGGGLVEHHELRAPQHRPGDRDHLPLPRREVLPALLDLQTQQVLHVARQRQPQHLGVKKLPASFFPDAAGAAAAPAGALSQHPRCQLRIF
mmetsp:Transcript_139422/g.445014  ORF Transcript_139422/g.445014 Transcript_139422/m.445014 type:complete len:263 (+) Transcript_139422:279-1067(+)